MIGQIKENFEKELKYKLQQKTQPTVALETSLLKIFKFYDLKNSGMIDKNQFLRAVAKIGIVLENMEASNQLFTVYDSDGDGLINYHDFTIGVLGVSQNIQYQQQSLIQEPQKPIVKKNVDQSLAQECLKKMRDQIQKRGQTGLMNFARSLKNQDSVGKGSLNLQQYNKAVRDSRINLDFHTLDSIFEYFDSNKIGNIVYSDLVNILRGDLPKQREQLIVQLFQLFDTQGSYVIFIKDLRNRFNPEGHPLVQYSRKQPDDFLQEFFSSIDTFTDLRNITDGKLSLDDFLDFWNFVQFSFAIDSDFFNYFNGVWGLNNIQQQQQQQQQYQQQQQQPQQQQYNQQQQFDRSPINQRQQQQQYQQDYQDKSPINQRQQQQNYQDRSPINQRQQQQNYQDRSPINQRQQQQQQFSPYSQQSEINQEQHQFQHQPNPSLHKNNLQQLPQQQQYQQQQQQQSQQQVQYDQQSQYSVQQSQKSHLSTTPVKRGAGNQHYSQYNLISGQDNCYQKQLEQKQQYQKQLQASPLQENQPNFDTISNHSFVSQQSQQSQQSKNRYVQNPMENVTQRQIQLIMQRVHKRLSSKGAGGFLGLQKQFMIADVDNDGKLNYDQFKHAIQKYRIDVTEGEIQILFSIFDPKVTKYVSYVEFLKSLTGEMNQQRQQIIGQAFARIDRDQDGIVNIYDVFNSHNSRNHPDVKNMKKQEDQVQKEFQETFSLHHQMSGFAQSENVTRDEFFSYFTNYSAAITDPVHFENIIKSCFNITHESTLKNQHAGSAHVTFDPNCKKGYLQDHHKYMIYGGTVAQNAPFGTFADQQQQGQRPIVYEQKKPQVNQSQQFERATPIRRKDQLDIFGGYEGPKGAQQQQQQQQQNNRLNTEESQQQNYSQQQNQVRQSMPQQQFNNFLQQDTQNQQQQQQQDQQQQKQQIQQQQQQQQEEEQQRQQQLQQRYQQQLQDNQNLQNQLQQMQIHDDQQQQQQQQYQQNEQQNQTQQFQQQHQQQQYNQQENYQQQQQQNQQQQPSTISDLRKKIAQREVRGFLNLLRQFKLKDLNLSGQLSYQDFMETFSDLRIDVNPNDLNQMFSQYRTEQNSIIYEQFFEQLVGDISEERKNLILKAFQGIDYERCGEVDIEDVKNIYYAQGHPDIQYGVSTEQEIRSKFNDALEMYFNLCVPLDSQKQGKLSYFDFCEFYKIISCTVFNDNKFQQIMVNCWQLDKFNMQQQQQ